MIGDLVDRVLPGKSRDDLVALLGPGSYGLDVELSYRVPTSAPNNRMRLLLRFDEHGQLDSWSLDRE